MTITVSDSGIGIPADKIDHVFDMFTQIHESGECGHTGLGIGLTLVKRLVEMHGGSVEVQSRGQNLGTTFVVRLPTLSEPPALLNGAPQMVHDASFTVKRRILVVDDNIDALETLSRLVALLGNEVREARDGLEALEIASTFQPEIVLMDLGMPNLNGYEAARRMRKNPGGAIWRWSLRQAGGRTTTAGVRPKLDLIAIWSSQLRSLRCAKCSTHLDQRLSRNHNLHARLEPPTNRPSKTPMPTATFSLRQLFTASSVFALFLLCVPLAAVAERPNVLFIAVDDLKPAIGCYGDRLAKTPNIDRLAARGTVFERAYCMQAVCAPSRNALLTGLRPETLRIYDLGTNFRRRAPDVVTLPQHFKAHGYASHGLGKIFHVGHGNHEDPASWSVPHYQAKSVQYVLPENRAALTREEALFSNKKGDVSKLPRGAAFENADVPDDAYADGRIATEAIKRLHGFKESGQPFFLAVGFVKPHLPFCAPKKYWDLHDPAKLPMPDRQQPPEGAPAFAPQFGGELRNYAGIPASGTDPRRIGAHADSRLLRRHQLHGRAARATCSTSSIALGLAENTIIVLWGDHGWHLGDHGMWCKHTNYEQATRAPLIIAAPGKKGGQRSRGLAEFVDVYPTLCDLAGVPKPAHLQGESLVPLIDAPGSAGKRAAFQVYPRRTEETGPLLGHAVRTDRWRYVEWRKADESVAARELYDMEQDPGETANLASGEKHTDIIEEHAKLLATRLAVESPQGLKLLDPAKPDVARSADK